MGTKCLEGSARGHEGPKVPPSRVSTAPSCQQLPSPQGQSTAELRLPWITLPIPSHAPSGRGEGCSSPGQTLQGRMNQTQAACVVLSGTVVVFSWLLPVSVYTQSLYSLQS